MEGITDTKKESFIELQQKVDSIIVPAKVTEFHTKIDSIFSSFTADQWKNWVVLLTVLS